MAINLEKKYKKGHWYWYASEKKRVNGKVKRVFQKYLGSEEQCIARLINNEPCSESPEVFKYGSVATLLKISEELGLVDIINNYMQEQTDKDTRFYNPNNKSLPSLGTYILLAAINRSISSTSKRDIYNWYSSTSLKRYWPNLTSHNISSQHFWDAIQTFTQRHLADLSQLIIDRVFELYEDIDRSCLLFDQTNYYTFIDTFNQRCTLAQRGANKQKRRNLRQVGYLLMVTKDGHIPVLHRCYRGNHNDITSFRHNLTQVISTAKRITEKSKITLVFDKGNVSKQVMQKIQKELHFVTSLPVSDHQELLKLHGPMECARAKTREQEEILAFVATKKIWGKQHKIVIGYSPSFYEAQSKSLYLQIEKAEQKLKEIQDSLRRYYTHKKGKKPKIADIRTRVSKILKHDNLNQLISHKISGRRYIKFEFEVDEEKTQQHIALNYGKTIHVTNRIDWTPLEIIQAYRNQSIIENSIKETKGMKHSLWWPMGHWTDQKIHVHGFYTFIALLLKSLVIKKLRDEGIHRCWDSVVTDLDNIYEVVELVSEQGQIVPQIRLSKTNRQQEELLRVLL